MDYRYAHKSKLIVQTKSRVVPAILSKVGKNALTQHQIIISNKKNKNIRKT